MRYIKLLVVILGVSIYCGCESTTESEPDSPDCEISVEPSSVELEAGLSDTLSGTIQSLNELSCVKEISWESNNPDLVSVEVIDDASVEVIAQSEGSTTVRAFNQSSNASTTINVSVTFNPVVSYTIDDINVAVANKFGSEKIITESSEQEIYPDWIKPNKIAYVYVPDGILYSVDLDGENKQELSNDFDNLISFDISKDNSKALISGNTNESELTEIFSKDLNEGKITRLTFEGNEAGKVPGFPYWSPDGQKITFQTHRDGNWEIYTMNADGSDQQNITNTPNQHETKPTWSNNGNKIAFVSGPEGSMNNIEVVDTDGSNRLKVADGIYPSWTSENRIIFTDGHSVLSVNSEGSDIQVIIDNPRKKRYRPSWKPEE